MSCPQSIMLGRGGWARWFTGGLCCTEGHCGQCAAGQVKSAAHKWTDRESVSSQVTGWSWETEFSLMTKVS